MPTALASARPSLTKGTSYDDVKAGKPPIAIQTAPKPSQARLDLHPMHRAASASSPELDQPLHPSHSRLQEHEPRRDSGLGTAASKRESRATTVGTDKTDAESITSGKIRTVRKSPSLPRIEKEGSLDTPPQNRPAGKLRAINARASALREASSLDPLPQLRDSVIAASLDLPSFSLEDLSSPTALQFSKRGSLLVKGRRPSSSPSDTPRIMSPVFGPVSPASPSSPSATDDAAPSSPMPTTSLVSPPVSPAHLNVPEATSRPRETTPSSVSRVSLLPRSALSTDDETLSQRIRSMYEVGDDSVYLDEAILENEDDARQRAASPELAQTSPDSRRLSQLQGRLSRTQPREEGELAGGLEDWDGVDNGDVDRFGFIDKKPPPIASSAVLGSSHVSLNSTMTAPEGMGISRMATQLRLAAEKPRRNRSMRSKLGRSNSNAGSARSTPNQPTDGRQSSASNRTSRFIRPTSSQASYRTATTISSSRIRRAGNHLPHNKDRRCVDEAGDMLTLPPGLAEIAESEALNGKAGTKSAASMRSKEREREDKWKKMAKLVKPESSSRTGTDGGGMQFTFDATNPKLISRTWKGIPDPWRGPAWWSFMESSAKKRPDSLDAEELIEIFHELVDQSCADDVQIDLDVPRTIGGHIMFRKRYRGGQRLLFRVLHALSLYFPDPGYVQGMAALAATILCYFTEERSFVMLVRMWEMRGLARLYRAGFGGLMEALGEFETHWLAGGIVGEKLQELGIPPTSYGTRWYLTLFNYSIPFAAQLRVWDVFLLLGDGDQLRHVPSNAPRRSLSVQPTRAANEKAVEDSKEAQGFNGCLDVLHAVAAALIDGTREILLDSDFDNAMKTLTSWIPIRDDELLMRVAKVEYKYHKQRR